jgi:deoxycytidine triphosphate deaminase
MFINPKHAIDQGWVTGIINPDKQIQPNAIDFTLNRVFDFDAYSSFTIYEKEVDGAIVEQKHMRGQTEIFPELTYSTKLPMWTLRPKTAYDAMSDLHVTLPEDVAAILFIRSTFNRNSCFISTGLYDSGFIGSVGFHIHNNSHTETLIGPGVRIGQIAFIEASSAHQYAGGYNTQQGQHWIEVNKG